MKKGKNTTQINIKVTEIDLNRLKAVAEKYEISMSNCVKHLIRREYDALALTSKANILTDK